MNRDLLDLDKSAKLESTPGISKHLIGGLSFRPSKFAPTSTLLNQLMIDFSSMTHSKKQQAVILVADTLNVGPCIRLFDADQLLATSALLYLE